MLRMLAKIGLIAVYTTCFDRFEVLIKILNN